MKNLLKFALALLFSATAWAAAPVVIQPTDLLTNSRLTLNSNFLGLYNGSSGLIDCSGTTGSFVVTLNGGGTLPVCHTLTWANILLLSGTPASFVTSFNSRVNAITLMSSDVAAVEQDLRNSASPNFNGLSLGGNLAVTGTSTFTGAITANGGITGSGSWTGGVVSPTYGGTGVNNGSFTLTLPSSVTGPTNAGTLVGSADTSTVTNAMLAGSITNAKLSTPVTGQWCGTTNTCSATAISPKIVAGTTAALNAASPAIATVTGISPAFTSSSDYVCTVTAQGSGAPTHVFVVTNVSSSSFTVTGPNGATDTVNYDCIGF